jgi:putative spermidine/putrescine transport system permease protein
MRTSRVQAWVLLAVVILVYVLILAPIVVIVIASFNPSPALHFPPASLSLRWYWQFFSNDQMTSGFMTSLMIAAVAAAAATVLGTMAGLAFVRFSFPLKGLLGAVLLSPLVFPGLILGVALLLCFQFVGLPILLRLVFAHTLLGVPFVMRSVIAGLEMFDFAIEEAARIHGATPWQAFSRAVLPSIQGSVVAGAVFAFVVSFGEVNATLFLVGPGTTTLPVEIFSQIQFGAEQVIVASASTLQMALVVVLVLALQKLLGLSLTGGR